MASLSIEPKNSASNASSASSSTNSAADRLEEAKNAMQRGLTSLRRSSSNLKSDLSKKLKLQQSSSSEQQVQLSPSFFETPPEITEVYAVSDPPENAPPEPTSVGKVALAARIAKITFKFRAMIWHGEEYFKNVENAREFKRLLIESGPVFIKLGQWMVQRPDVFPAEFLKQLESLQREAPTHSFAETRTMVDSAMKAFGETFEQAFSEFSPLPLASGSIAQVYKAVWHGRPVVVKVRHPNITERVNSDLALLNALVKAGSHANNHYCRAIDVQRIMREMMAQCDMSHEKRCLESMRHNFANNPLIHFPEPYFATQDILIESFVDGIDYRMIGNPECDKFTYSNAEEIQQARDLCKQATMAAFLQMILHDALLHADLHGGNILYRIERFVPPGRGAPRLVPHVTFLDFGMILHLNDVQKDAIHQLIVGLYAVHANSVVDALAKVAMQNNDVDARRFAEFAVDCAALIQSIDARRVANGALHVPTIMTDLLKMLHRHRLLIDGNMVRIMVDFILISEGRENLEHDNLTDDTIEWVLYSEDGEHFPIIDHVMEIPLALEKRDNQNKNNGDGTEYCSTSIQSISLSRAKKYASVESLGHAIAMRGASMQETGSVMNKKQRTEQKKQRVRIAVDE